MSPQQLGIGDITNTSGNSSSLTRSVDIPNSLCPSPAHSSKPDREALKRMAEQARQRAMHFIRSDNEMRVLGEDGNRTRVVVGEELPPGATGYSEQTGGGNVRMTIEGVENCDDTNAHKLVPVSAGSDRQGQYARESTSSGAGTSRQASFREQEETRGYSDADLHGRHASAISLENILNSASDISLTAVLARNADDQTRSAIARFYDSMDRESYCYIFGEDDRQENPWCGREGEACRCEPPGSKLFLAWDRGHIVGIAAYQRNNEYANTAMIWTVVHPKYRGGAQRDSQGRSITRALIEDRLQDIRSCGYEGVLSVVYGNNTAQIERLHNHGWQEITSGECSSSERRSHSGSEYDDCSDTDSFGSDAEARKFYLGFDGRTTTH